MFVCVCGKRCLCLVSNEQAQRELQESCTRVRPRPEVLLLGTNTRVPERERDAAQLPFQGYEYRYVLFVLDSYIKGLVVSSLRFGKMDCVLLESLGPLPKVELKDSSKVLFPVPTTLTPSMRNVLKSILRLGRSFQPRLATARKPVTQRQSLEKGATEHLPFRRRLSSRISKSRLWKGV